DDAGGRADGIEHDLADVLCAEVKTEDHPSLGRKIAKDKTIADGLDTYIGRSDRAHPVACRVLCIAVLHMIVLRMGMLCRAGYSGHSQRRPVGGHDGLAGGG